MVKVRLLERKGRIQGEVTTVSVPIEGDPFVLPEIIFWDGRAFKIDPEIEPAPGEPEAYIETTWWEVTKKGSSENVLILKPNDLKKMVDAGVEKSLQSHPISNSRLWRLAKDLRNLISAKEGWLRRGEEALCLDAATALENPERQSIVSYLRWVAHIEIGSVLTSNGRELVGMCAEWIENRLDERHWQEEVVKREGSMALLPRMKKMMDDHEQNPSYEAAESLARVIGEFHRARTMEGKKT